jgi:hypothetical protein
MEIMAERTRRWTAKWLAAIAVGICAIPASGQPPPVLGRGPGNFALNSAVLNSARHALDAQTAAALAAIIAKPGPTPPAPPEVTLTYEPDPRLSDWTRLSMIDALSEGNATVRDQLERSFAKNAVLKSFDTYMSARGYSSHNVADDMAEMLLVSWQVVSNGKATDSQVRGVHAQTQAAFLNSPALRTLTASDRQLMAERFAYQVILTSSAQEAFSRDGDHAHRRQLQESSEALLREQGVDAAQMHLTDQGFRK